MESQRRSGRPLQLSSPQVGGPYVRYVRTCNIIVIILDFFLYAGGSGELGPWAPLCFLVFVFSLPPSALEAPGRTLPERSKTLRPASSRVRGADALAQALDLLANHRGISHDRRLG